MVLLQSCSYYADPLAVKAEPVESDYAEKKALDAEELLREAEEQAGSQEVSKTAERFCNFTSTPESFADFAESRSSCWTRKASSGMWRLSNGRSAYLLQ